MKWQLDSTRWDLELLEYLFLDLVIEWLSISHIICLSETLDYYGVGSVKNKDVSMGFACCVYVQKVECIIIRMFVYPENNFYS